MVIPKNIKFNNEDLNILNKFKENYSKIENAINKQDINFYMNFLMETLFAANKYFNDQEPWNKKNDLDRLNTIIYVSLELIRKISILMYPIIPETSLKALNIFDIKEKDINFSSLINNEFLKQGMKINKINILIKKIIND